MVLPDEGDCMAKKHERLKKNLHNFKFSNWGVQHTMRCIKVDESSSSSSAAVDQPSRPSPSKFDGVEYQNPRSENGRLRSEENGSEVGLEEFREKLMSDIRAVKESILREQVREYKEEGDESEPPKEMEREPSPPVEVKPWNLRKRREACKAPVIGSGSCDADKYKCKRLGFVEEERVDKSTRPKFVLTLSKKEVEDDLMMMGHPPTRRPKKRPRTLQKKINLLHPAFYFSEVNEDIYKV